MGGPEEERYDKRAHVLQRFEALCASHIGLPLLIRIAVSRPEGTVLMDAPSAPNFLITVGKIKCYTPFTAQPGPTWKQGSCERVIVDVKDEVNNTTLGLYSFWVFVDCVWSAQKIALGPGPLLVGRRKVLTSNQSVPKRPHTDKIAKTSAPKRRKVEVVEDIENVNPVAGIMTRSQKKLTSVSAGLQM
ncbi:hypothetical protein B0H14DRAFT_3168251 [Mycena olivaceomarginata]|nr:hypothetical protein B0H14DRAFT_3168251 [Mycena olivaceomarginata]